MNFPINIDLQTKRVVYSNDLLVGVRAFTFDKGTSYNCPVTFSNGSTQGVSVSVSSFTCNLAQANNRNNPLVSTSVFANGAFTLNVASTLIDYAIQGSDTLNVITEISFVGNGITYNLSIPTVVNNNTSIGPAQEYISLSQLDTDATLAANSDSKVSSQKAVKTYIDGHGGIIPGQQIFATNGTDLFLDAGASSIPNVGGNWSINNSGDANFAGISSDNWGINEDGSASFAYSGFTINNSGINWGGNWNLNSDGTASFGGQSAYPFSICSTPTYGYDPSTGQVTTRGINIDPSASWDVTNGGYIDTSSNGGSIWTANNGGVIWTANNGGQINTSNSGPGIYTSGYSPSYNDVLAFDGSNFVPQSPQNLSIIWSQISSTPTTLAGYGITDASQIVTNVAPSSGDIVNMNGTGDEFVYIQPSGTLGSLYVYFNSNAPIIGAIKKVFISQAVTSLTITNPGGSMRGASISSCSANSCFEFVKVASFVWLRIR